MICFGSSFEVIKIHYVIESHRISGTLIFILGKIKNARAHVPRAKRLFYFFAVLLKYNKKRVAGFL